MNHWLLKVERTSVCIGDTTIWLEVTLNNGHVYLVGCEEGMLSSGLGKSEYPSPEFLDREFELAERAGQEFFKDQLKELVWD